MLTCATVLLKMRVPHHEVQKHELEPSYVTTIVLLCEAEERCVQTPFCGTKPKNSRELRGRDLTNLTIFITSSNTLLNLNSVNQLIFVIVKCGVLFEVRTEFLNNI
jgi:hypothetical protein